MIEPECKDIEALAVGAWILGTDGGGNPYLGLLNTMPRAPGVAALAARPRARGVGGRRL